MKRLVLLSAMLAYLPVAQAEGKGEFTHEAEYRLRYRFDQNADLLDNKDPYNSFVQRFKFGTTWRNGEKFSAHLSLLHNATWGDYGAGDTAPIATMPSGTASTNGITKDGNMILVNQAYATWMLSDSWALKFGRGNVKLGQGLVISQNDWQQTPYAYDGAIGSYEHDSFRLNLFAVKAIDLRGPSGNLPTGTFDVDPEANFYGFNLDWKNLPEWLNQAAFSVMNTKKDLMNTAAAPGGALADAKDEMRFGLGFAGDTAGVDYTFNYAANNGKTRTIAGAETDLAGSMMHAEVGYSMPEVMKSRIFVTYHTDTGDDASTTDKNEGYDTFYYELHGTSGMMDVIRWGNLNFIRVGYTFEPMETLNVGLHYWMFNRNQTNSAVFANINGGKIAANNGAANTDSAIGSEIDLVATKTYDNGFQINSWVGMFMPGAYLKNQSSQEKTYTQFFVEGKMTF